MMPYILPEDRVKYDGRLGDFPVIDNKGELEYCIYRLMVAFMKTREKRYDSFHDCVYAAQHCSDEFRRMFLDPREDRARESNGDIE